MFRDQLRQDSTIPELIEILSVRKRRCHLIISLCCAKCVGWSSGQGVVRTSSGDVKTLQQSNGYAHSLTPWTSFEPRASHI
jgi:hypothetical protein